MRGNLIGAGMGLVAVAAVLTACSSGGSSGSTAAADSTTPSSAADSSAAGSSAAAGTAAAGSAAQTVPVTATEFTLALGTTTFTPGSYTFQMSDAGHATHAIEIAGPGVAGTKSDAVGPGGTASLTVTLQKGTYTLWCPVANHRALGMQTTLTVG